MSPLWYDVGAGPVPPPGAGSVSSRLFLFSGQLGPQLLELRGQRVPLGHQPGTLLPQGDYLVRGVGHRLVPGWWFFLRLALVEDVSDGDQGVAYRLKIVENAGLRIAPDRAIQDVVRLL